MLRRPPRSTRTDTLFPYTTLFRSWHRAAGIGRQGITVRSGKINLPDCSNSTGNGAEQADWMTAKTVGAVPRSIFSVDACPPDGQFEYWRQCNPPPLAVRAHNRRSEERRVGKDGDRTCHSRWCPEH